MKKLNTKKGFSLIELLVVIAIIGVLSAVCITAYTGYTASAKEQAARTQFAQIVSLVNAENAKCGVGSGTWAWGGNCNTTYTASTVATHLYDSLGMKNPYDNTQAQSGFITTTGSDPDADGEIDISVNGTEITIKQRVNDTPTVLSQVVDKAS